MFCRNIKDSIDYVKEEYIGNDNISYTMGYHIEGLGVADKIGCVIYYNTEKIDYPSVCFMFGYDEYRIKFDDLESISLLENNSLETILSIGYDSAENEEMEYVSFLISEDYIEDTLRVMSDIEDNYKNIKGQGLKKSVIEL